MYILYVIVHLYRQYIYIYILKAFGSNCVIFSRANVILVNVADGFLIVVIANEELLFASIPMQSVCTEVCVDDATVYDR